MPWQESDVEKHFKGLSSKEKRQWCHVANGALEAGDDDGTACHKANGVVKKNRMESEIQEGERFYDQRTKLFNHPARHDGASHGQYDNYVKGLHDLHDGLSKKIGPLVKKYENNNKTHPSSGQPYSKHAKFLKVGLAAAAQHLSGVYGKHAVDKADANVVGAINADNALNMMHQLSDHLAQHFKIHESIESKLYAKAIAMVEAVRMQQIAAIFEGALDNQPEGILHKAGWTQTKEKGDNKIYTHTAQDHRTCAACKSGIRHDHNPIDSMHGHEIHVSKNGNWRHYDGDKCLGAGFTGEKMRKHLGEAVLNEADPKPRVEVDNAGKPVIPNRQHYLMYFQDMQAGHIKDALRSAHERWAAAEKVALTARQASLANKSQSVKDQAAMAAAHLQALGIELSVGNLVLKQKQNKMGKEVKKQNVKIKSHARTVGKVVNTVMKGSSPLAKMLAKGVVKAFTPKPVTVNKTKNYLATPKAPRVSK
jgi:hypothetical protein